MVTQLEYEMKSSTMIRMIAADIREAFKKQTEELYADENGKLSEPYRKSCARWDIIIATYCNSIEQIQYLHMLVEKAFQMKVDLDKCPKWKMLMRAIIPPEFIKKMNRFTQVPQMAIMDKTPLAYKKGEAASRAIFRRP